jgi:hypothetical protein
VRVDLSVVSLLSLNTDGTFSVSVPVSICVPDGSSHV